jgi:hypothetical protein
MFNRWTLRDGREFREAHPRLYAARHVVFEVLAAVIGMLGVGAEVSGFARTLLPRMDWSWLPDLPHVSLPGWLHYLDPLYWVPDWDSWGWVPDMNLSWLHYVTPIVIATAIAATEVKRHSFRGERERHSDTPGLDDAHC